VEARRGEKKLFIVIDIVAVRKWHDRREKSFSTCTFRYSLSTLLLLSGSGKGAN